MKVGIAGIGLIGSSLARAYKQAGHEVFVHDIDTSIVQYSILAGVSNGTLDETTLPECELLLLAIHPTASEAYLRTAAPFLSKEALVIDCCGTKRAICEIGFALAKEYGFTYIGGHPMAGTQFSGFKNGRANMFEGASMVLVPPAHTGAQTLQRIKDVLAPCGFGHLSITTAENHDRIIAFTSQLAHVVSNAYVKSPTARDHHGFSAGSYQDLTRVAALNQNMWAQLFLENRDNLVQELDWLIGNLANVRDALAANDEARVRDLMAEGTALKREIDG
ncbi:MAG: prephenate dehydrogenase/arogenate dehydrogenase family protein [Ruminococcaceae bacterium]|nr:prephenate dehydrogenase/arogenate dehydrogenase family protein [Oscillospiraceae bacterium]